MKFNTNNQRHWKRLDHPFYGNQHVSLRRKRKEPPVWKAIIILLVISLVLCYKAYEAIPLFHPQPIHIISPIPDPLIKKAFAQNVSFKIQRKTVSPTPTAIPIALPTKTPVSEQYTAVHNEIEAVFGKYASLAFKLLQDPQCHENGMLRPEAKNINWDKKIPGLIDSTDWGVFQINDHWQGVTNIAFLTDYHINIRMAWNIFEHHNYHFDAWTCGKALGI